MAGLKVSSILNLPLGNWFLMAVLSFSGSPTMADSLLRRGVPNIPLFLDPAQESSLNAVDHAIQLDLLEGLTRLSVGDELRPGVADTWAVSDDGETYVFHLRKNAKWSDGVQVTAEDFVFAWNRVRTLESFKVIKGGGAVGENGTAVEFGVIASDALTLTVKLIRPDADFPYLVAGWEFLPVPKHLNLDAKGHWGNQESMVGNGAYQIFGQPTKSVIQLKRADAYWDRLNVKISDVVYSLGITKEEAFRRFRLKEIDIVGDIPTKNIQWAHTDIKQPIVEGMIRGMSCIVMLNDGANWMTDQAARQALSLAIDRSAIESIQAGGVVPTVSLTEPSPVNYKSSRPSNWPESQFDRVRLASLLWKSKKERPSTISILVRAGEDNRRIANAIGSFWQQTFDVKVRLEISSGAEFNKRLFSSEKDKPDFVLVGVGVDQSPQRQLRKLLGFSVPWTKRQDIQNLLARADTSDNSKLRQDSLGAAETAMLDDALILPLFVLRGAALISPQVGGFRWSTLGIYPSRDLSLNP